MVGYVAHGFGMKSLMGEMLPSDGRTPNGLGATRELNFEKQSCCTKSCSGHRRNWGQDGFRIHPAPAFL